MAGPPSPLKLFMQTPIASALFSYNPGGVLVSESEIPATEPTTHARRSPVSAVSAGCPPKA